MKIHGLGSIVQGDEGLTNDIGSDSFYLTWPKSLSELTESRFPALMEMEESSVKSVRRDS